LCSDDPRQAKERSKEGKVDIQWRIEREIRLREITLGEIKRHVSMSLIPDLPRRNTTRRFGPQTEAPERCQLVWYHPQHELG